MVIERIRSTLEMITIKGENGIAITVPAKQLSDTNCSNICGAFSKRGQECTFKEEKEKVKEEEIVRFIFS